MKREIKFRAYIKDEGRLLNVNLIDFDDEYVRVWDEYGEDEEEWLFKDCELMCYTGLHDKNGKPIFEGDIVHGYDQEPDRDDGYIGSSVTDVVNFKYGAFWIGDSWYNVMVMTPPIIEVVGNVHDTPELLEEEK